MCITSNLICLAGYVFEISVGELTGAALHARYISYLFGYTIVATFKSLHLPKTNKLTIVPGAQHIKHIICH